jgi:hypothetical protein
MKISQLITEAQTDQIFTAKLYPHFIYNFVVKLVGEDGNNRPIYVGHLLVEEDGQPATKNQMFAAIVMRVDGSLLAGFYSESLNECRESATLAINEKRKGYGQGHRYALENWNTYSKDMVEIEGYEL